MPHPTAENGFFENPRKIIEEGRSMIPDRLTYPRKGTDLLNEGFFVKLCIVGDDLENGETAVGLLKKKKNEEMKYEDLSVELEGSLSSR